jgi:hypothetical protein
MDKEVLNLASFLGVIVSLSGGLICWRYATRWRLARQHDVFHGVIALLSGGLLIFQGERITALLALAYFLLLVSWLSFAWESVRMRQWMILQQQNDLQNPDWEVGGSKLNNNRPRRPNLPDTEANPQSEGSSDSQVP